MAPDDPLNWMLGGGKPDASSPTPGAAQSGDNPLRYMSNPSHGALPAPEAAPPPTTEPAVPGGFLSHAWSSITGGDAPKWLREAESPITKDSSLAPPAAGHALAEGVVQGAQDVWNNPSTWALQKGADLGLVNQSTVDAARANMAQRTADFQRDFGNSGWASGGRTLGQVIGTAPVMGAAGGALSAAGRAIPAIAPVTDFLAGASGGSTGGWLGTGLRAASRAAQGAWTGAGQAALSGQDVGSGAATGAIVGPVAGAVMDPVVRRLGGLTGQRVGPVGYQAPDEAVANAGQAQTLVNAGVPLKLSQVSPDPTRQEASRLFGGGPAPVDQMQAFRAEAMRRAGMPGTIANDATVAANDLRVGQGMDAVVNRNPYPYTAVEPRLAAIEAGLPSSNLSAADQSIIRTRLNDVMSRAAGNNGIIDGPTYRALTDSNSELSGLVGDENKPQLGNVARQVRSAIHDGFRSVAPQSDQDALAALQQQYRATRAIDDARLPNDTFDPAGLVRTTDRQAKNYGGTGVLDDLANAGKTVLQPAMSGRNPYSKWAGPGVGLLGGLVGAEAVAHNIPDLPTIAQHPVAAALTAAGYGGARGLSRWAEGSQPSVQNAINAVRGGNPPLDLRTAIQLLTQGAGARPAF